MVSKSPSVWRQRIQPFFAPILFRNRWVGQAVQSHTSYKPIRCILSGRMAGEKYNQLIGLSWLSSILHICDEMNVEQKRYGFHPSNSSLIYWPEYKMQGHVQFSLSFICHTICIFQEIIKSDSWQNMIIKMAADSISNKWQLSTKNMISGSSCNLKYDSCNSKNDSCQQL